jgi:hypothetical protein
MKYRTGKRMIMDMKNAPGGIEKVQPGKNEISHREENDNGMKTPGGINNGAEEE